jgi:hypothetical protein
MFLRVYYIDITKNNSIRFITFREKMAKYVLKNENCVHLLFTKYILKLG